jgi:hypothetical protein
MIYIMVFYFFALPQINAHIKVLSIKQSSQLLLASMDGTVLLTLYTNLLDLESNERCARV